MKIIIIGGGPGGLSAAVRARRLSENAEIIVFEKGNTFLMPTVDYLIT